MSQPYPRFTPPAPASRPSRPDSLTWETALGAHYVPLCEYVLRLVGSAETAEDIVQDLFLKLWDTRGPHDVVHLTPAYLYVAARNRALKDLRHRRVVEKWIERAAAEEMAGEDSPEDVYLRGELDVAVARAIAELPARCRTIFLLRRRDLLSYREITTRVGVSLGTVKSQMWRATVLLRTKLASYFGGA